MVVAHPWASGARKSTILKAISSVLHPDEGSIFFEEQRIDQVSAHRLVEISIAHVPEGRRLFARLTVKQKMYKKPWSWPTMLMFYRPAASSWKENPPPSCRPI